MARQSPPPPDLASDHALAVAAVREAGALAMRYFGGEIESWYKAPGEPVSEADLEVNALLESALRGARPDYGWLSEESRDDAARLDAGRVWIVDPIDGTRAFLKGRPEFTICVALAAAGAPVAAAVFNPATGELFDALEGGGARLDGKPIRVSRAGALAGARFVLSRGELHREGWRGALAGMAVSAIGSTAYRLALVAAGRFDATATIWPRSEWDVAAGELLVREAGGIVTDAAGAAHAYNRRRPEIGSIAAAGGELHAPLVARLAAAAA